MSNPATVEPAGVVTLHDDRNIDDEIASRADFSTIRYAQCWEDADILLAALEIQPEHVCLSVASAGDNTLAILSQQPAHVVALDLSPAQLACLDLRVAAYRCLDHPELLDFIGARPSDRRHDFYNRCRPLLSPTVQDFWDARGASIDMGFGNIGRFESYLRTFGTRILPLLQSKRTREQLLIERTREEREAFYNDHWDTWRWRAAYRFFFSRRVMGWLGRDPSFFEYVDVDVADRLLARTRYALIELDPVENPYLQWILLGKHGPALPYALRAENFQAIRENLDSLEIRCQSLEEYLSESGDTPSIDTTFDRFNLSDIFEYISLDRYAALLHRIVQRSNPGARLVYWNMMAPRRRPESMSSELRSLRKLSDDLYQRDKAFFYSDFVVEEVL